jgi:hypothetical protein
VEGDITFGGECHERRSTPQRESQPVGKTVVSKINQRYRNGEPYKAQMRPDQNTHPAELTSR